MNILNITSCAMFPVSTGGSSYTYSCIMKLAEKHIITLLCPKAEHKPNLKNVAIYDVLPNSKFKFVSPKVFKQMFDHSKLSDKVIIDFPWFGFHCLILRVLNNIKFDVREHNIEFLRFKSYKKWFWPFIFILEYCVYFFADKIWFISIKDKDLAKSYFSIDEGKCVLEAYIPDPERFYPTDANTQRIRKLLNLKDGEKFILFFGQLDFPPNREAVKIIKEKIIPRLNTYKDFYYRVVICGKNPPNFFDGKIIYTGFIEKIEYYVQACDVMINPLVSGGGVKTKAVEALACGKHVISTAYAAEGINTEMHKGQLIIVNDDNWDDFAEKIVNLKDYND